MKSRGNWFPAYGDEHEKTDDEAPPQWEEQPAREGGHDE